MALASRTDETLILEGWARDIVSKLEKLRKELKVEVTDRIHIEYVGPAKVQAAIEAQRDYIASETLALSLKIAQHSTMHEVELNGVQARFSLTKEPVKN